MKIKMKLITTKRKFIRKIASQYQCQNEGMIKGLKFWKQSLISIKLCHWRKGKMTASPARLIDFAYAVYKN